MINKKNKKSALDAFKININEDMEIKYWSKTLKVTRQELIEAINKVGPQASRVKQYLHKE